MTARLPSALGLLGAVALLAALTFAFAPPGPMAGSWQYTIVPGQALDLGAGPEEREALRRGWEDQLNTFGNDGWELVQVQSGYAIMKRPR